MTRTSHTIRHIGLALLLLPSIANPHWLTKILGAGSEVVTAGKVVVKAATVVPEAAIISAAKKGRAAGAIGVKENGVVLATGQRDILVATAGTAGYSLTPDGLAALKAIDLIVPEDQLKLVEGFLSTAIGDHKAVAKFARSDGTLGRIDAIPAGSGARAINVEHLPGVFVESSLLRDADAFGAFRYAHMTSRPKVATLFDESDADVVRAFDNAAGEAHTPMGHLTSSAVSKWIGSQEQQTLFIVGHVESNAFVVRDAAGAVKRTIPIVELEKAARNADANLVLLGCGTAGCSRSTGFFGDVNAMKLAGGIRNAMGQISIDQSLSEIALASGDILLRPHFADSMRRIYRAEQKADLGRNKGGAALASIQVSLVSRGRSVELADRIIPGVNSRIQFFYVLGAIALLVQLRKVRSTWGTRLPAPKFERAPFRNVGVKLTRALTFVLTMPFAAALGLCILIAPWIFLPYDFLMSILSPETVVVGTVIQFRDAILFCAAIFCGWRWHKLETLVEAEKGWLRYHLSIPLFLAGLRIVQHYAISPLLSLFTETTHYTWTTAGIEVLVLLVLSGIALRYLLKHELRASSFVDAVISFPLIPIEWVSARIIRKGDVSVA